MHEDRPAFGQRLAELAELGVIEFRSEPLDVIVERRLKAIWEERSCPHCGADSLHAAVWAGAFLPDCLETPLDNDVERLGPKFYYAQFRKFR